MEVQTANGKYSADVSVSGKDNWDVSGNNLHRLRRSARTDRLCLVQDRESSTIGMGRMAAPFRLFYIGPRPIYVAQTGNNGDTKRQVVLGVRKTINSSTGQEETLQIVGDNHELRKSMFYAISNEPLAPINSGSYFEMRAYNEGTFSPAGPTQWMEHSTKGTVGINLNAEDLQKRFKRCLDDLDFRTSSMEVSIPTEYLPAENSRTFCGGDTLVGSVNPAHYQEGIRGIYALTQVINALGHLSGRLFRNGGVFNVNMDWQRQEKDPELSPEFFSYCTQKEAPAFQFRIAPGRRGSVWVKPANIKATATIQFLPEYLTQMFPGQTPSREKFDKTLFQFLKQFEGQKYDFPGLEEKVRDPGFLEFLRSIR